MCFKKDAPDLNIIYGYLQIGDMTNDKECLQNMYPFHPHSCDHMSNLQSNMLYIPSENLSFLPQEKGYGTFNFHDDRVLTMNGKSRSVWKEIPALMPENINGNHKNSAKDCGLKYSGIWQEKVLLENELSNSWAKELFMLK